MENLPAQFTGEMNIETYAANLQAKLQFCDLLLKSGLCPPHFKTAQAIYVVILIGQEIGFSPMQALHSINLIQGTPALSAQGMKAKILQAGGKIHEVEWTAEKCILEGERDKHKQRAEYTVRDAQLAGLLQKDNWKKQPKAMLYARAVSTIARNQWADVIKGLGYTKEELQDHIVVDVPPQLNGAVKVADEIEAEKAVSEDLPKAFPAGKYKDVPLSEVPANYLQKVYEDRRGYWEIAEQELLRREAVQMQEQGVA